MKILALEFSSVRRSAALVRSSDEVPPVVVGNALEASGRSARVFGLITAALHDAGWEREGLDVIAVGLGPGSYHGIRAAIAIAEGWALGRSIRLVGVSSVAALALQFGRETAQRAFTVAVDAQRGEFYRADYVADAGVAREVHPLRLVKAVEIENLLRRGGIVCGPGLARWFLGAREIFPEAAAVGCLAVETPESSGDARLEPIYLRQTLFVKAPPPRFG